MHLLGMQRSWAGSMDKLGQLLRNDANTTTHRKRTILTAATRTNRVATRTAASARLSRGVCVHVITAERQRLARMHGAGRAAEPPVTCRCAAVTEGIEKPGCCPWSPSPLAES